jgi:hypothetical protein
MFAAAHPLRETWHAGEWFAIRVGGNSGIRKMIRLSLIGMAGIGKSYWSMRLKACGFKRFCCDERIAEKLGSALIRSDGTTMSMGEWMGFPFHDGYQARAHLYMAYEAEVVSEVLEYFEASEGSHAENVVVDTTGSVIYVGRALLDALRRHTTVVYFSTPNAVRQQLLDAYVSRPHPMLWKETFQKMAGETNMEALARCYPRLLASRQKLYALFADVTLDYYQCREKDFGVNELLTAVAGRENMEGVYRRGSWGR